jgi:hypothetical protein
MPRQADNDRLESPSSQRPSGKVVRRRRRRPARNKPELRARPAQTQSDQAEPVVPWSRAPRPVEPPPKNPNIFSYTYTVWKS